MTQIKLEVVDEDDDENLYDNPVWDSMAREFSWHDLKPSRRGYCLPPFLAESQHKYPYNDIRDDPSFKTYYLILSRPFRAGGVYTNIDSMHFAMQGYDQKPHWKVKATWEECVSTWQMGCRLGAHGHELPDDSDLPPLPMSPSRMTLSQERVQQLQGASDSRPRQPTSTTSSSRAPAPPRGAAPSTPRTSRFSAPALRSSSTTPVLRPTPCISRSGVPVTPSRTFCAPSSRSPGPSNVHASRTPSPVPASPTKFIFASRGSTPLSGVLTRNPLKLKEMLESDDVFVAGGETAVEEVLQYFEKK